MKVFVWCVRLAVAAVFVAAALPKIADPAAFLTAIRTFHALPEHGAAVLALWLPWVELFGALAVLWPRHRTAALAGLGLLTIVFLGALGQAWWRGLDINCGCFGGESSVRGRAYLPYVWRDLALLAAIVGLLWLERCRSGVNALVGELGVVNAGR